MAWVLDDYNKAAAAAPIQGCQLYFVNAEGVRGGNGVWVWAKTKQAAIVAVATEVLGVSAHINRPGIKLDGEDL